MDKSSNTPRLLEVAKEFNIGKDTVVAFLTDKGFVVSTNPSTKLTEQMYNALQVEFAQDKIAKNRRDRLSLPPKQELLDNWRKIKDNSNLKNEPKIEGTNLLGKINLDDLNLASRPKKGEAKKTKEQFDTFSEEKSQQSEYPIKENESTEDNKSVAENIEIKASKHEGPKKIIGRIELPVSQPIDSPNHRKKYSRIPLETSQSQKLFSKILSETKLPVSQPSNRNESASERENTNPIPNEKSIQKSIWKMYIQAKRKYIQRLSSPIKIYASTWELKENGTLKVEIDPKINNDELFNLIKRNFTNGGVEPKLEFKNEKLSFFTVSTANSIDEVALEKFQEQTASYYLEFSPLPVIEGEFKVRNSPLVKFNEYCTSQNIVLIKSKSGKYTLTLSELKKLENYNIQNLSDGISISTNVGCVISIKPIGILREISVRYRNISITESKMFEDGFSITTNAFLTNIFTEIECLYRCEATYLIVVFDLSRGEIQNSDNINSILESQNGIETFSFKDRRLTIKITFSEINEGANIFHNLFHKISLIDTNATCRKATIFYHCEGLSLPGYNLNENKFEEEFLQVIRTKLRNKNETIKVNSSSISFDFKTTQELHETIERLKDVEKYVQLDWRGDDHKMKVTIDIVNPYNSIELAIKERFKQARTRYNESTGTLQVRNHYKYNSETQNFVITQFKGFCEQISSQQSL